MNKQAVTDIEKAIRAEPQIIDIATSMHIVFNVVVGGAVK
jgi:hypothetical protein